MVMHRGHFMSTQIKKALGILNKKGFTLIELMIVVGIIGILVSIAAPNFARYQSKSRQAEAKIALAAIYTGEKAFYSEYTAYMCDLAVIGYTPEGSKRFYAVGWSAANTATVAGFTGTSGGQNYYAMSGYPATGFTACAAASLPVSTQDNGQGFTAGAYGWLRNGAAACDGWTITDTKALANGSINL